MRRRLNIVQILTACSPFAAAHIAALEAQQMSTSITLTFRWPMGHRILGLEGGGEKCRNIHGHNWIADVELPNDDGELEFGAVKSAVGGYIDGMLDHGFAVAHDDPFRGYLAAEDLRHLVMDTKPTTEAIAAHLASVTAETVGRWPLSVRVQEGYRNAATWRA
ncbi:QueD-like 6-pyruvoyl-tetrahydropterin synthase [Gordonia phage Sour]|uniref:QueD-like queosine biosynthesis protein n=1 Tax=Gordonia phage Sour TaxID=2182349 RepID=A0A2U8UL96_9CAUD|nr:QueD-like 6-pyruvoyl-tetrahydropterin synthase [Gordonia phage Sour]AWN04206.1 QueD-like queosine biosynthesis protein [Gordonia phage Sour]